MFNSANLSTANYDALLIGWSVQSLQPNVAFSAGNAQYSKTAKAARDTLTDAFGWTVSDAGVLP